MNQQSSIEFELAESHNINVPPSEGTPADPTALAPEGVTPTGEVPAPEGSASQPAAQGSVSDLNASAGKNTDSQPSRDLPTDSDRHDDIGYSTDRAFADKPLLADEHNTVISNQRPSHDEPIPVYAQATAEELQARLFEGRDDSGQVRGALRIGRMEVFEKIGAGGMGAVFRAVDTELSREVALKVLHPRVASDPALVSRFRNEARACAQLNHDNIARVYYADEHLGVQYIAYEYAAGRTIKELINERGQLTTAEVVNYAIQATLALGHIESAGIIHRDIKPSNIILTNNGRIKVVDLGLARRETEDSIADLTVAGTTLGTFDYLAPEQARDARTADIRSDIYSLGCSIYHMLTGCAPYPDGTAVQKMLDHQGKDPPDVRQKNKQVPRAMAAIVQRMMMTSPDQRYQAPGQLLADLIHLAGQMGLRSVPAEGIVWRRVPVTKVRDISGSLFLAGAIAVICVTALVMHFLPASNESSASIDDLQWLSPAAVASASQEDQADTPSPADTDPKNGDQGATTVQETTDGLPTTPTDNAATQATPVVTEDSSPTLSPLIVRRSNGEEERFESLREAWDKAQDGDVIELDFDGPALGTTTALPRRRVAESPRIVLRSARGRQPVVHFSVQPDATTSQSRFFELSSNVQLQISGVHFQVDMAGASTQDDWSLFDFRGANSVRMKNCTVDVRNDNGVPFSIFRTKDTGPLEASRTQALVALTNVGVRGVCHLLSLQSQLEGDLTASECGFALDGCLLRNLGSSEMLSQGEFQISLQHCTTLTAQPVVLMQASEVMEDRRAERTLPTVSVMSRDCVFSSFGGATILTEMRGNLYQDELQELLAWDGINNFYHGFDVFWRTESGLTDEEPSEIGFREWVENWNRQLATQETSAEEFLSDVWRSPSLFISQPPEALQSIPVNAFELNSTLFSTTGAGRYPLQPDQMLPGVRSFDLPDFPDFALPDPQKTTIDGDSP